MNALWHTKTLIPPMRNLTIDRRRLHQQMAANPDARLILVSAPAGFGKSSCLVSWVHALQNDGARVAWYALDEQDNDPTRFAAYLARAFQVSGEPFSSLFAAAHQLELHDVTATVLNEVTVSDAHHVLVLDDYHLITEPVIHDALNRLCEYLPANLQIVIGTRADPPLQLARLRTHGAVTEIRMADLCFSQDEIASLLQTTLDWSPTPGALKSLENITEGWAAALSLIIMTLNKHAIAEFEQTLDQQFARYSQTQQHLFEYFAAEVLAQQTDAVRRFMLNTCVLNRLDPSICTELTRDPRAPLLLNQLAAESLFVIPLSDVEPIYRYHHLFEQFLRQYLLLNDKPAYVEKHLAAARWYAAHDTIVRAVNHALAAEDYGYAAKLIEDTAWAALTSRGEIMTIIGWLRRFPDEALDRHPRLCLYFSRALYLTGEIASSEAMVQRATDQITSQSDDTGDQPALQAIAASYQATLAAYRGDVMTGRQWIEPANALRHTVAALDRVRIANTDAFLWYLVGDVPAARRAYTDALRLAQEIQHDYLSLDAHYYLAQIDLLAADLEAAKQRCEAILGQYTTRFGPLSVLMLPLAQVCYQRNQLVEAEAILREAMTLAERAHIPDVLWSAHVTLADILLARGEAAEAVASIRRAYSITQGYQSPMMMSFVGAAQARVALASGDVDAATDWAQHYQTSDRTGHHQDYQNLTLAHVWLKQANYEAVLTLLDQLIARAQPAGRTSTVLEAQMLRALASQASGALEPALAALKQTLPVARQQGFVRPFLNAGTPMTKLLRLAVERGICTDDAAHLLDRAQSSEASQHPADSLTEREIEVLQLIASGASNQNIADTLVLSVGTVKSHIHHIMNKLDAQNRTEAVSKARSLHILPD